MATNDCGMPKKVCVAGEQPEGQSFCVDPGDCTTKRIVRLVTLDADCAVVSSRYAEADNLGNLIVPIIPYVGIINRVTCAVQRVQIVDSCDPLPPDPPIPPIVVDAPTCTDGVTLPINTKPELTTRVVQEEGTAFLVKLCEPQKDFEVERACNAAGEHVLVQYDAGVVPPIELSRTNMLTGLAEPAGTLRKCDSDEIELVDLVACLNGVEIVGVAVMTDADSPVMTGELWRNPVTGAWGPLPAGAVIGKCVTRALHLNSVHWSTTTVDPNALPGTLWGLIYKGSFQDYVDAGGDASATEIGMEDVNGWVYIETCAETQPKGINQWTWFAAPANPIVGLYDNQDGTFQEFPTTVTNGNPSPVCAGSAGVSTCVEGKAWYDEATGALVRVNTLDGVDVTTTVSALLLKEGPCPEVCETQTPVGVVSTWG